MVVVNPTTTQSQPQLNDSCFFKENHVSLSIAMKYALIAVVETMKHFVKISEIGFNLMPSPFVILVQESNVCR